MTYNICAVKRSAKTASSLATALLHVACLLSGTAAVAYEVLWSRSLVVSLGNSADATAAVLAAFMGAMGAGAVFIGRRGDSVRDPLLVYAALEGVLAVCALAVPHLAQTVLPRVAAAVLSSGVPVLGWVLRLALAVLIVAVPAAIMGATLPLVVRRLARSAGDAARWFGFLYMANTLGGCAGAAAAGLVVVPLLGIRTGSGLAALLNLGAAALALWARRAERPRRAQSCVDELGASRRRIWALAVALAVTSGAFMLLMERMWSRLLVLVLGHDTYGFAAMLVAAIAGLALGGGLGGILSRRRARALTWAAALLVTAAALAMGCFWITSSVLLATHADPFGILADASLSTRSSMGVWHPLALAMMPTLLPSVAVGAVFPLACAAVDPRPESTGREVGLLTAANSLGCVLGALLPTVGVVELMGVQGTVTAGGVAAAVVGVGVILRQPTIRGVWPRILSAAALAAVAAAALLAPGAATRDLTVMMVGGQTERILYHREGRTATVTVTRNEIDGVRQLFVNAVNEVSTRYVHDQSFSLLGHLGPLLHPDPRDALVICHGAGLTAGAVASHPQMQVTVVDLESRVVEAAREFSDLNGNLHENSRVSVVVDDGRNHLLTTDHRYDVITVDSTHPRAVDSWVLYTTQFYELASRRLDEDGIIVQWVPLHGMSEREFRILVGTFAGVFSHAQLWANVGYDRIGFTGYALLVARRSGPLFVHADRLSQRIAVPSVGREMHRWGMEGPADLLDCFIAGPEALRRWTRQLPANTDDRPLTPFVTGWSQGPRMGPASLSQITEPMGPLLVPPADDSRARTLQADLEALSLAELFLLRGEAGRAAQVVPASTRHARYVRELEDARSYQRKRAARSPSDPWVLLTAGTALNELGDARSAARILVRATGMTGQDPRPWFHLGLARARQGRWEEAERAQRRVLERSEGNVLALNNLALAILALGDPYEATEILRDAARQDPRFHRTWIHLGEAHMARGEPQLAQENYRRGARLAPTDAQAHHGLGRALAAQGDHGHAIASFHEAAQLDRGWFAPHYEMGLSQLALQEYELAEASLRRAILLDGSSGAAWTDLGLALAGQKKWARAAEAHLRATDLDPQLARSWLNLGLALKTLGEMQAAEAAFRKALVLDPEIAGR